MPDLGSTSELYLKLSKNALQNARLLYIESNILYEQKHFSRSYALSIFSIEELSKSLISKAISCGKMKEGTLRLKDERGRSTNILLNHTIKQRFIGMWVAMRETYKNNPAIFHQLIPKEEYPKLPASLNLKRPKFAIKTFNSMEDDRKNSIYVGLKEKKLVLPDKMFNHEKSKFLFEVIPEVIFYCEAIVNMTVSQFQGFFERYSLSEYFSENSNQPKVSKEKLEDVA